MTRINCVPPEELSRQHLLAEYRELPRVFKLAEKAFLSGKPLKAPDQYTLGVGHVKFFYKRLRYCKNRFHALCGEMIRRKYKPQYADVPEVMLDKDWWQDWVPDSAAIELNRQRILERKTRA